MSRENSIQAMLQQTSDARRDLERWGFEFRRLNQLGYAMLVASENMLIDNREHCVQMLHALGDHITRGDIKKDKISYRFVQYQAPGYLLNAIHVEDVDYHAALSLRSTILRMEAFEICDLQTMNGNGLSIKFIINNKLT